MEDLRWENTILQQRISFCNTYSVEKMEQLVHETDKNDVFYCYCGGKAFENYADDNDINNILKKIVEKKEK